VASFKNVDEEKLLEIPGVVYIPQVGKVTVAMLERNLIRLYDQFHSVDDANVQYIMQEEQARRSIQIQRESSTKSLIALQNQRQDDNEQKNRDLLLNAGGQTWYGHPLNLYTAGIVTVLLFLQVMKQR
jgi:hypothetical protein